MRELQLDIQRMQDKESSIQYFVEMFELEECHNLDALYDLMSEVSVETTLIIKEDDLKEIAKEKPVVKVLQAILDAVSENPYLHIRLV